MVLNKLKSVLGGDSDEDDGPDNGFEDGEKDASYEEDDVLDGSESFAEWDAPEGGSVVDDMGRLHRDFIAPSNAEFKSDVAKSGEQWVQSLYVDGWPQHATSGFLERLFSNAVFETDISIHIEPREQKDALADLQDNIGAIQAKLEEEQKNNSVSARDTRKDLDDAQAMYDLVSRSGMTMFDCSMYINHRAYDEQLLRENLSDVRSLIEKPPANAEARVSRRRQDKSMVSTSPIGVDELNKKTAMMGGAIGAMMPFSSSVLIEENGVDFGVQPYNGSPVIVDRFGRDNGYNMLTVGMIGSGKSFSTKLNLVRTLMHRDDVDLVMLDPLQGFTGVTEALQGDRVVVGGDVGLNPLELKETPQKIIEEADGDLDPYSGKLKDVMAFFETFFAMRNIELGDERGILEKAVQKGYADKGITRDPSTHHNESPTMGDVMTSLKQMSEDGSEFAYSASEDEKEKIEQGASRLLIALQPFSEGGEFENLSRETDIDVNSSRVTYLDLQQQEGRGGTGLMMQLLFNAVYERAKETDKKVIFVIDEARYIMKDAANLDFLEQAVRHSRHYDLSIQFVTQTVDEFFAHEQSEAIASNCSLIQLNKVDLDFDLGREKLNLNDNQIEYVRNATPGSKDRDYSEALLYAQGYGWMPIHIKASQQEAAVVDFEPSEDDWEALPGHTSDEEDAKAARIQQALKAANDDTSNVTEVGGNGSFGDKLDSLERLEGLEGEEREEAVKERRETIEEMDRDELVDLIASGEYVGDDDAMTAEMVSETQQQQTEPEPTQPEPTQPEPTEESGAEPTIEETSSSTSTGGDWGRDTKQNKLYHLRIIANHETNGEMPVLDALNDAFTVVGTDPSVQEIRSGNFGVGFDAIIVSTIKKGEINSALTDIGQVQSVTVKEITDDVDWDREAGQIDTGVNVDALIARVNAETEDAGSTFSELQRETEYVEDFDKIEDEMEEMDFQMDDDEVEFDTLVETDGDSNEDDVEEGPEGTEEIDVSSLSSDEIEDMEYRDLQKAAKEFDEVKGNASEEDLREELKGAVDDDSEEAEESDSETNTEK